MAQHGTSQCRLCSAVQFSAVLCYATQRSTQRNTRRYATRPEVMRHCVAVYMYVQCARKSHLELTNRIYWERSAQAGWRRACRGWSLRRRFLRGACQAQVSSANKANNKKKPGLGRRTEKCNGKRGHKREGVTAAYMSKDRQRGPVAGIPQAILRTCFRPRVSVNNSSILKLTPTSRGSSELNPPWPPCLSLGSAFGGTCAGDGIPSASVGTSPHVTSSGTSPSSFPHPHVPRAPLHCVPPSSFAQQLTTRSLTEWPWW